MASIIIEGPDGGGKTHLAKDLAELYGLEYRRPTPELLSSSHGPGGRGLVDWWYHQLALKDSILRRNIYDRCFYISDPIYQQAQPQRALLASSEELVSGIKKLWTIEPILVFCLPPFEVQLANVRASGRDRLEGVDDKVLEKISNAYWACYAVWQNALFDRVLLYDYTNPDAFDFIRSRLDRFKYEEV